MKKRRLKREVKIYGLITLVCITLLVFTISYFNKANSLESKLKKAGYTKEEIVILEVLDKEQRKSLLKHEYDEKISAFINEKYFMFKNLDAYLEYSKMNRKISNKDIVARINVEAHKETYENSTKTNVDKKELMLVNKYNNLAKNYVPKNLVDVSVQYAYDGNKLVKSANDAFIKMNKDAALKGYNLVVNTSYRSYDMQESIYMRNRNESGTEWADKYSVRGGYSEHQTGLVMDISDFPNNIANFEESDAYKWVVKNAHKYGFILRYPKGCEEITKFQAEPWHIRYVGKQVAKDIYEEGITLDEYYAFYINK